MGNLKDIYFIFPVMLYYALEALIVGLFITLLWYFVLERLFGHLGYIQIVSIYWIIKMLMFNVFNLINGLNSNNQTEDPNNDTEE